MWQTREKPRGQKGVVKIDRSKSSPADSISYIGMFSISKPFLAFWCNLHFIQTPDADRRSQEKRIKEQFSTLKDDIKRRLYKLYQIDFDLFGYEADQYM